MIDTPIDVRATALTRARYQRLAPLYDRMEALSERSFRAGREKLWSLVQGPRVLEAGVGTGQNMPFWPQGVEITALDLTPGMLDKAQQRARQLKIKADLRLGDVQALEFADASFDTAVATCVFCSVPDPVLGLRELKRVVKPDGQIILLEHMRSPNGIIGAIMDALNPLVVRIMGANINRRTLENIRAAGWSIVQAEDLGMGGIMNLIVAQVQEDRSP